MRSWLLIVLICNAHAIDANIKIDDAKDSQQTLTQTERVYDNNDIKDVNDPTVSPAVRDRALSSSMWMTSTRWLSCPESLDGICSLSLTPYSDDVCPDVKFSNQLRGGFCSATFVGGDTGREVITAAHCIDPEVIAATGGRNELRLVFGYHLDQGLVAPIKSADVYKICNIPIFNNTRKTDLDAGRVNHWGDHARIVLDRSPDPSRAAPVVNDTNMITGSVFVAGHPAGLPLKIVEDDSEVLARYDAGFLTRTDLLRGNSGGGVFLNSSGALAGIVAWGHEESETDTTPSSSGFSKVCTRPLPADSATVSHGNGIVFACRADPIGCFAGGTPLPSISEENVSVTMTCNYPPPPFNWMIVVYALLAIASACVAVRGAVLLKEYLTGKNAEVKIEMATPVGHVPHGHHQTHHSRI